MFYFVGYLHRLNAHSFRTFKGLFLTVLMLFFGVHGFRKKMAEEYDKNMYANAFSCVEKKIVIRLNYEYM